MNPSHIAIAREISNRIRALPGLSQCRDEPIVRLLESAGQTQVDAWLRDASSKDANRGSRARLVLRAALAACSSEVLKRLEERGVPATTDRLLGLLDDDVVAASLWGFARQSGQLTQVEALRRALSLEGGEVRAPLDLPGPAGTLRLAAGQSGCVGLSVCPPRSDGRSWVQLMLLGDEVRTAVLEALRSGSRPARVTAGRYALVASNRPADGSALALARDGNFPIGCWRLGQTATKHVVVMLGAATQRVCIPAAGGEL